MNQHDMVVNPFNSCDDSEKKFYALAKGAPEVIAKFLKEVPAEYEKTYKHWSRSGCRVLAVAWRCISGSHQVHEVRI